MYILPHQPIFRTLSVIAKANQIRQKFIKGNKSKADGYFHQVKYVQITLRDMLSNLKFQKNR